MKHTAALSALRALCHLRLPAETLVPAALEALHALVPSYRNLFDWTDEAGNLVRYYFDGPVDPVTAVHYFEQFYNRREAEVMPGFREAVRATVAIRGAAELAQPRFWRSALYNEVWRPQGLHTRIEALVRTPGGRTCGSLVLYRAPEDPPFTAEEEHLLAQAATYLARGLEEGARAAPPAEFSSVAAREATVILDAHGRIAQFSGDALKLLLLSHGDITPEALTSRWRREEFAALDRLWQQYRTSPRLVHSLARESAWGRFEFEAEPTIALLEGSEPLVQVRIAQFEPRVVALRRALDRLPLSPTQREVCALLHRGASQAEIARELRIAATTVADHVRKAYVKLDVHSVAQLSARIEALSAARAPQRR